MTNMSEAESREQLVAENEELRKRLTAAEEKLVGFECNSELGRMRAERLENKLSAATALLRGAVECGEWFDGTFHCEMNAHWLDKAKEVTK